MARAPVLGNRRRRQRGLSGRTREAAAVAVLAVGLRIDAGSRAEREPAFANADRPRAVAPGRTLDVTGSAVFAVALEIGAVRAHHAAHARRLARAATLFARPRPAVETERRADIRGDINVVDQPVAVVVLAIARLRLVVALTEIGSAWPRRARPAGHARAGAGALPRADRASADRLTREGQAVTRRTLRRRLATACPSRPRASAGRRLRSAEPLRAANNRAGLRGSPTRARQASGPQLSLVPSTLGE